MPTHQSHDQSSEANQRRANKHSLKDRSEAKYNELDAVLQKSTKRSLLRRSAPVAVTLAIILAVVAIAPWE